ncbi:hypothetical protein BU25DRAFT_165882 [Macroventuria anomochaeta]|uniref:Uncharacterized protein n=1 Tax=Macroventuria anomochaeta TaxID=301207 RepID=A0ACB6RSY6_9PLEO|nr:uncharacterized protein BU25DRAFT_165882 [Macroventuria anomochaeta]KAF2624022.1 hypothetical protein BU25DRAFT_165882 [Macroventuria anomochaeta]
MGRSFRVSIPQRSFCHLRYRLALVLFIFVLFKQYHLFFIYRKALAAKYSPTELLQFTKEQTWMPDEESAHFQDRLVANRAAWRNLGEGREGKTFVYQDSVIKTFTPGRSPFRNCAPGVTDKVWPTEVPASLYFGGSEHNATSSFHGFLPVQAYFMAVSSASQAEWHLVTPLLKGGNLKDLAIEARKQKQPYRDIDAHHRPTFERLLHTLGNLHEAGYCHDDIKSSNIFVADDAHWILGDLGNLRQVSHPYHSSLLWRENKQLSDCRANDVMRALKSYMRFVRDSAIDADALNAEFFDGREPLSRLFWSSTANCSHLSAAELRAKSITEHPHLHANSMVKTGILLPAQSYTWLSIFSRRWGRHYAVNHALQTRMGEKLARWWALTGLFGVPITTVCGVRYP